MSWGYIGKANTYCSTNGVKLSAWLTGDTKISSVEYTSAISGVVQENKIREVVIDGDAVLSKDSRDLLSEILNLLKSLRIKTVVMVEAHADIYDAENVNNMFDVEFTNIAVKIDHDSVKSDKLASNLETLMSDILPHQNLIGYATFNCADEAADIFKIIRDYDIKDVIVEPQWETIAREAALISKSTVHVDLQPELYLTEEHDALVCHASDDMQKRAA